MEVPSKKIRILIVEDDMIDRLQVSRAIEKTRLDVELDEALTLLQAREALRMKDFDVVILDNHLPDGYGAQRRWTIRSCDISTAFLQGIPFGENLDGS